MFFWNFIMKVIMDKKSSYQNISSILFSLSLHTNWKKEKEYIGPGEEFACLPVLTMMVFFQCAFHIMHLISVAREYQLFS